MKCRNTLVKVWLEKDILAQLQERVAIQYESNKDCLKEGCGGVAHYLRQLAYRELGLLAPEPWAAEVNHVHYGIYQGCCRRPGGILHFYLRGEILCGRVETTTGDFQQVPFPNFRDHLRRCRRCQERLDMILRAGKRS